MVERPLCLWPINDYLKTINGVIFSALFPTFPVFLSPPHPVSYSPLTGSCVSNRNELLLSTKKEPYVTPPKQSKKEEQEYRDICP